MSSAIVRSSLKKRYLLCLRSPIYTLTRARLRTVLDAMLTWRQLVNTIERSTCSATRTYAELGLLCPRFAVLAIDNEVCVTTVLIKC